MRTKVLSAAIVASALAIPAGVSAQQPAGPGAIQAPVPERATRPLFLTGVKKSGPLNGAGMVGLLIPLKPLGRSGDLGGQLRAYRGVILEAGAGSDGFEAGVGWARRLKEPRRFAIFGEDVMAKAFRKRSATEGAGTDATYVGGEVGLTLLTLRVGVGAATRVEGPESSDRTIFTWGVGFHIGR
jgi:hypothetical protein